jgi:DNA-directed RNA polymerase specialized sigma24 family protein
VTRAERLRILTRRIAVMRLRQLEGLTYEAIAGRLGLHPSTVAGDLRAAGLAPAGRRAHDEAARRLAGLPPDAPARGPRR